MMPGMTKPVRAKAVVTLGVTLEDLDIGTLRWLIGVCNKAEVDDATEVLPVYADTEDPNAEIVGLEVHIPADKLSGLAE